MRDTRLSSASSDHVLTDRRRPGRVAVDDALMELLRNPIGTRRAALDKHVLDHEDVEAYENDAPVEFSPAL